MLAGNCNTTTYMTVLSNNKSKLDCFLFYDVISVGQTSITKIVLASKYNP